LENIENSLSHVASDLKWVVRSPFLTKQFPEPDLASIPQTEALLLSVAENPKPLLTFLSGMKRQNLGTYFEYLVFFWLSNLEAVTLHATNLQINVEKQTLGELDVIFSYLGQVYHWELAIKFYANSGSPLSEGNWLGPLKRDNLKRKLDRLFDHQLPLCHTDATDQTLRTKDFNAAEIHSFPFVKGILFNKTGNSEIANSLPSRISGSCQRQVWCTLEELTLLLSEDINRYCILPKLRWMSELQTSDWKILDNEGTDKTIAEKVTALNIPQFVAFGSFQNGLIEERCRIFIMPEDWETSESL